MNTAGIINQALIDIGKEDQDSLFFAQGVTDPSAVFGTLADLSKVVPRSRLIEMPVAENAAIGIAIGAAISGKRPIVSLHRVEFLLLALEQIFNNAAKANFLSGGSYSTPLLVRAIIGRGWGQGPSHSQGFESVFASVPGLKVVCPSVAETAYELVWRCYEDDAPVIFLEHRWVHYANGTLNRRRSSNGEILPIKLSKGNQLTLVSYGYLSLECLLVVEELSRIGVEVDLIDLQVLRPLKMDLILESVETTGHLLVVDQGYKSFGIGAEIISQVTEQAFEKLKTRPQRIGQPNLPAPSSIALAKDYYCTSVDIAEIAASMLELKGALARELISNVKAIRNANPFDVPNEYFKGPF
tara:strand:- start:144 stop:1208 length:1065 start_codon:yes stop_codon:yes gene_type:complete